MRHEGFELFDAGGIDGVGAEELGEFGAAFLLLVGGEALPEFHGFAGVVSGAGHVEGTEAIGFEFLAAGEFEHGEAGGGPGADRGEVPGIGVFEGLIDAERDEGGADALGDAFAAVAGDHVPDFVSDDRGQAGVVLGDLEHAGIDADFATGESEGVGAFVFEDDELPLGVLHGDDRDEASGDALELGVVGSVLRNFGLAFDLLELREAHARFGTCGDGVELFAAGVGDGGAGGDGDGEGDEEGGGEGEVTAGRWH